MGGFITTRTVPLNSPQPSMIKNLSKRSAFFAVCLIGISAFLLWFFNRQLSNEKSSSDAAFAEVPEKTRSSSRESDGPEQDKRRRESIALAAEKWYQELLEKYPEMKPVYRDVPDEKNGYLQYLVLRDRVKEPQLPEELKSMLEGSATWNPASYKAWLAKNQEYFESILRMAELTDCSTKGIDLNRLRNSGETLLAEFGMILRASARLAMEEGNRDTALRYFKALSGLGDRFIDIEEPSVYSAVLYTMVRSPSLDAFREQIFPALGNDPEVLKAWNDAVFRKATPGEDSARIMKGELNVGMRHALLPLLLGDSSKAEGEKIRIDDAASVIDSYTKVLQKAATAFSSQGVERFVVSEADFEVSKFELSSHDAEFLKSGLGVFSSILESKAVEATTTAMVSAALAIRLGENPKPDPVSGLAFRWDPANRTLSTPEVLVWEDSIKIP
jgi:tetratricopeptide (TPR) repeat protein